MKYVDLIVANNSVRTDRFFTYGCLRDDVSVGQKVFVPFNRGSKLKEAYVFEVRDELEEGVKGLKYVESFDEQVKLTEEAIKTCIWMRRRYACKYIDAVNCFTPAGSGSKTGKERNPVKAMEGEAQEIPALTDEQEAATGRISRFIEQRKHMIFLLRGVTGSGKTEVYMRCISSCLNSGRNAIMLVPEISLTKQMTDRFVGRFGAVAVAVLHSRLSPGERYDEWARIRSGRARIAIGARSAVFAPFENIGAIILDEEHEATYKSDMTPKYDTVEIAIKRVKTQNDKGVIILGSATPSVVSYRRAEEGIYEKIELRKRYNEMPLPPVETADMRAELKAGNRSVFSRLLYSEMTRCLSEGSQVILFLNRRGYSTFVNCRECGYVMRCPDCGISLTYHKESGMAVCHYCGYKAAAPDECPECGGKYIRYFGAGTEKVEEEARSLFPGQAIARLDLDAIRRKGDLDKVLGNFKNGRTRILVGTQLVAKGLDFKNVGLVGIISADTALNIPDFRSAERTFQLITQAAGRAGRGYEAGKVVIQTYSPGHYSIISAASYDYEGFYKTEIALRELLRYPPYADLIQAVVTSDMDEDAKNGADRVFSALRGKLSKENGVSVFKPQELPFFKRNGARYQILVKSEKGKRGVCVDGIAEIRERLFLDGSSACALGIDINPYSFL